MILASPDVKMVEKKVNHFRRKVQLRMRHVRKNDFHAYKCVAKNTIGKSEKAIDVFGEGKYISKYN